MGKVKEVKAYYIRLTGAPYTEAVLSATGLSPPEATTPVSAPDKGTGIRPGVGPRALYCSSTLLLACVVKVNYE